jgi:chorismate synthase
MKKSRNLFGVAILIIAIITSCAKPPQTEIDAANASVDSAKTMGADIYVPEAYNALQDSLKSAMELIEAQKSKLFKKYTIAKEKLVAVATLAKDVQAKNETRKVEIKAQIDSLKTQTDSINAENKVLVKKAPKGKGENSAIMAINNDISSIDAAVAEAATMVEQGDLLGAQSKLQAAKEKALSVNEELSKAVKKGKVAKPAKITGGTMGSSKSK